MLEKESPLGATAKRRAPFYILIALGIFIMVSAGLSFLQEAKEGSCVERSVECGLSSGTQFLIGDGLVLAGLVGRILVRRLDRRDKIQGFEGSLPFDYRCDDAQTPPEGDPVLLIGDLIGPEDVE